MKVQWKPIINYEDRYEVCSEGKIISLKRGIFLKPKTDKKGYLHVSLKGSNKKETFSVHRLVAVHFIENEENKRQVNHINLNKRDNSVENLEWVTPQENVKHALSNSNYNKKRTQVEAVCHLKEKAIGKDNLCRSCYMKKYLATR